VRTVSLTSPVQSRIVSLTLSVHSETTYFFNLPGLWWAADGNADFVHSHVVCPKSERAHKYSWRVEVLSAIAHKYSRRMICRKTPQIFLMSARAGLEYNYVGIIGKSAHGCFGSGSGLDPDSNGSANPDPDLGRPKLSPKKGKTEEISCLKSSLLGRRREITDHHGNRTF